MAVVAGGISRVTGIDGRIGIFQAGPRGGPQDVGERHRAMMRGFGPAQPSWTVTK